jgi:hypothetical protein
MSSQPFDVVAASLSREIEAFLESTGSHPVAQTGHGQGQVQGLFEDALTVVGYVVYQTVGELLASWMEAQEEVARAISRSEFDLGAKAWDGYLVLATPERSTSSQSVELAAIRSNTRRLRKLLMVGEDLQSGGDLSLATIVGRCLAPLAPLDLPLGTGVADPLADLGARVHVPGLSAADIDAVVEAYRENRPLIQALHDRTRKGDEA